MLYEYLTSPDIEEASKRDLIAILPIGSIEIHGPHMPVGTDSIAVYTIAKLAAEKEESVVLPPLYYAYVPENRHFPGTISLTAKTLLSLLEEICSEISRNGFKKILIVNGHGGNTQILRVFLKETLHKKRDYVVYAVIDPLFPMRDLILQMIEGRRVGHACEIETSIGLYLFGDLIKMDNVKHEADVGSMHLPKGIETPVDWQAYAIQLYLGDPRKASKEKGKIIVERLVEYLADTIRRIKQDDEVPKILDEFYSKSFGENSN